MKFFTCGMAALCILSGVVHAAGSAPKLTHTPANPTPRAVVMSEDMVCPSPYTKYTQGVDVSKGESYCVKTDATCPDAYSSSRNPQSGQLTCTPKIALASPDGWAPGAGNGAVAFNSIPQPFVKCPKATQDWQWGTTYYKESWNKMGCRANLKPAS